MTDDERTLLLRQLEEERKARQRSQQLFKSIIEENADGILVVDMAGVVRFVNKAAEALLGRSAEDLVGQEFGFPIAAEKMTEIDLIGKNGKSAVAEMHVTRSEWEANPVYLATLRNVTEKKQAEEALKSHAHALQERNKELNCLYGISRLVEDPENSLADIIEGTLRLLPYSWQYPEIACGRIVLEDREYVTESFRQTPWKLSRNIAVNGETIGVVEVCYLKESPVIDEGPFLKEERHLIDAIAERISRIVERHRAHERLLQSEQKFRDIFNSTSDAIFILDMEGRMLEVNDIACRRLGYSRDELLGMTPGDIDTDEYGGLAAERMQQIEEKGRVVVFETAHRCRDGSAIPVELSSRKVDFEGKTCILSLARDISERLERQYEYAQILNTSIDGFWVLDDQGALLEVNPAAAEMLGCSREEMLGRNISEIDANESPERIREHVRALRKMGYERFESRHRHKSGRLVDVEISASYIPRSRGRYVAFIRDITERKNAEEALRASEQLTRSIIDASEDIIVFKDTGFRFRVVNPAMCRMLNKSGDEIIGKTDFDLFPRQQAERFFQADQKLVETGQALMLEESVEGIDGLRWVSTVKSPVVNETGEIEGIVVISRDKTEQRLAEQSLQNEKLRLSHVIEGTRAGIWDWRVQTGEIEVNERWAQIIGYRLEELAPVSRQTWKQFVHPEDLARSEALLEKHFQGELEYYECECRVRHKQGHWVWIQDRGKVTEWDRTGRPERMTGTHIDVSRQKELEQEQRSLEYRLQQSQKAESLSRMAGAIAHHFNNQLSVVSGHLELAMEDLHADAEIRQNLNEAIKAGHRASHISSQMLAYLGQHKGRKEMVDLSEMCRQHLPKLEAILAGGVSLDTDLRESGPVVYANEGELRQALTGLILNAWEAETDFSGSVSLRTRIAAGSELEQSTTYPVDWSPSEPYYACLEVSDTGCGISPDNLDKIFDPFFTTKFTGRGLGLPVVLGMARAAGGGVGVDSQVDRGTTIRIFMALAGDPCRSLPEEPAAGPKNDTGCTVLLVEDQKEVRTLVANILQHLGYTAIPAGNGSDALAILESQADRVDCVITDLSMPEMDGWQILEAVKNRCSTLPVILASGYEGSHVMDGRQPASPDAFLQKPYQMAELKAVLGRVMRCGARVPAI